MMKNEFDWHIQINKMQNLNDMIGKQLECVDAERLAHTRQKKIRSKKRKDTFVAAKRRHNLCASRGVGGKHTAEGVMYEHRKQQEQQYFQRRHFHWNGCPSSQKQEKRKTYGL